MSIVLGLNAFHAGASAALIIDGKPIIAVAEERLNRIKYYAGFPKLAILECLKYSNLDFKDIDAIAIGRDRKSNLSKKIQYTLMNPSKLLNLVKIRNSKFSLNDIKLLMVENFGVEKSQLKFKQYNIEHHIAHIASAYYFSGWDNAAGFSLDGSGDFVTCMMSNCENRKINVRKRIYVPNSLGSLYTMISEFIGYGRYGDEGKVMGLAPLGKNTYKDIFDDIVIFEKKGIKLNPNYFRGFGFNQGLEIGTNGQVKINRHYSDLMIELFGAPRKRHAEITQRDMDLAFGVQYIFEKGYLHLLNILYELVPNKKLVIAGGCALNSVANGKIFNETPFKETFIQPAAGDDGLAIGAALFVSQSILKDKPTSKMINSFLGSSFDDECIQKELEKQNISFLKLDRANLIQETTNELVNGKVVGWFQGRSEWGPRALGNRSILAHPGLNDMKDVLNARIKHREAFRPFAPSILAEFQKEVFESEQPSPFMLHVYKIKAKWRTKLPAVNHIDNTGRVQTVQRDENPLYYDLIKCFYQQTGIPILLNTSFNENEPIVYHPSEAINCFKRTNMDTLVIGSFICLKNKALHEKKSI